MPKGLSGEEGKWRESDVSFLEGSGSPEQIKPDPNGPAPTCPVTFVNKEGKPETRALVIGITTGATKSVPGQCDPNFDWTTLIEEAKAKAMSFVQGYTCPSGCTKQFFHQSTEPEYISWLAVSSGRSCNYSVLYHFYFACDVAI